VMVGGNVSEPGTAMRFNHDGLDGLSFCDERSFGLNKLRRIPL
jgi:hypothetical protein